MFKKKDKEVKVEGQGLSEADDLQKLINLITLACTKDELFDQWNDLGELKETLKLIQEKLREVNSLSTSYRFKGYYTDALNKLLRTYMGYNQKESCVSRVSETKEDILNTLPLIIEYFKGYLDKLYSGECLDIASEVEVITVLDKNK